MTSTLWSEVELLIVDLFRTALFVRNDRCWNNSLSECAYPPRNSCNCFLYCYFFILFYVFILKRNICVIGHLIFGKRRIFPASMKLPLSGSHNLR